MSKEIEIELIEEYTYLGEKRFRFKIKGTNIIINVKASNLEEGAKKALEIIRKVRLEEALKKSSGGAAGI